MCASPAAAAGVGCAATVVFDCRGAAAGAAADPVAAVGAADANTDAVAPAAVLLLP